MIIFGRNVSRLASWMVVLGCLYFVASGGPLLRVAAAVTALLAMPHCKGCPCEVI